MQGKILPLGSRKFSIALIKHAIFWPACSDMGMQEHGEFDQHPEYKQQKNISRVFLFKYSDHG